MTPLMLASRDGYSDVVRVLLSYGAHPNAIDEVGAPAQLLWQTGGIGAQ